MSEKYTRISEFHHALFSEGSPVVILAGALLRDNNLGRCVAQLKMQNVSGKAIASCKVRIRAYGAAGVAAQGVDEFTYLELSAQRGEVFGSRHPVYLPDASAATFAPEVLSVAFFDGTSWETTGASWEPVSLTFTPLADALGDTGLEQEFVLEQGRDCRYMPEVAGSLRLCACGTIGLSSDVSCAVCGRDFESLKASCDVGRLRQCLEQRREQESTKAEEMDETWKRRKPWVIALGVVAVLAMVAMAVVPNLPFSKYQAAKRTSEQGRHAVAAMRYYALGDYEDAREQAFAEWREAGVHQAISAGGSHTVALREDGTVVATGSNFYSQSDVSGWTDIVAVAAGVNHTLGLKSDGTVVAAGNNPAFQCDVSDWTDIVAISAGDDHSVGLRSDGTVVAVGGNGYGVCDVSGWTDIVAIAAGENHTLGLKSDGTVVVAGKDDDWECYDAELWEGVAEIAAGENVSVALTLGGDVLAAGSSRHDEMYVTAWDDMNAISADGYCTVGVHSDGSVSASGEPIFGNGDIDSWTGIEAVSAGPYHVVGLREDGTVVAAGNNHNGQCDVEDWENIGFPE